MCVQLNGIAPENQKTCNYKLHLLNSCNISLLLSMNDEAFLINAFIIKK